MLLWLFFILFQEKKKQTENVPQINTRVQQWYSALALGEKCSCCFLLNIIIAILCVSHVAVALFSPITLYLLNSSFLFIVRTLIVSREQRIALLDEHSHADVFSNYLACCNSAVLHYRLEVIKKGVEGGGHIHGHYFFNLRPLLGLIWYCSQSWK